MKFSHAHREISELFLFYCQITLHYIKGIDIGFGVDNIKNGVTWPIKAVYVHVFESEIIGNAILLSGV